MYLPRPITSEFISKIKNELVNDPLNASLFPAIRSKNYGQVKVEIQKLSEESLLQNRKNILICAFWYGDSKIVKEILNYFSSPEMRRIYHNSDTDGYFLLEFLFVHNEKYLIENLKPHLFVFEDLSFNEYWKESLLFFSIKWRYWEYVRLITDLNTDIDSKSIVCNQTEILFMAFISQLQVDLLARVIFSSHMPSPGYFRAMIQRVKSSSGSAPGALDECESYFLPHIVRIQNLVDHLGSKTLDYLIQDYKILYKKCVKEFNNETFPMPFNNLMDFLARQKKPETYDELIISSLRLKTPPIRFVLNLGDEKLFISEFKESNTETKKEIYEHLASKRAHQNTRMLDLLYRKNLLNFFSPNYLMLLAEKSEIIKLVRSIPNFNENERAVFSRLIQLNKLNYLYSSEPPGDCKKYLSVYSESLDIETPFYLSISSEKDFSFSIGQNFLHPHSTIYKLNLKKLCDSKKMDENFKFRNYEFSHWKMYLKAARSRGYREKSDLESGGFNVFYLSPNCFLIFFPPYIDGDLVSTDFKLYEINLDLVHEYKFSIPNLTYFVESKGLIVHPVILMQLYFIRFFSDIISKLPSNFSKLLILLLENNEHLSKLYNILTHHFRLEISKYQTLSIDLVSTELLSEVNTNAPARAEDQSSYQESYCQLSSAISSRNPGAFSLAMAGNQLYLKERKYFDESDSKLSLEVFFFAIKELSALYFSNVENKSESQLELKKMILALLFSQHRFYTGFFDEMKSETLHLIVSLFPALFCAYRLHYWEISPFDYFLMHAIALNPIYYVPILERIGSTMLERKPTEISYPRNPHHSPGSRLPNDFDDSKDFDKFMNSYNSFNAEDARSRQLHTMRCYSATILLIHQGADDNVILENLSYFTDFGNAPEQQTVFFNLLHLALQKKRWKLYKDFYRLLPYFTCYRNLYGQTVDEIYFSHLREFRQQQINIDPYFCVLDLGIFIEAIKQGVCGDELDFLLGKFLFRIEELPSRYQDRNGDYVSFYTIGVKYGNLEQQKRILFLLKGYISSFSEKQLMILLKQAAYAGDRVTIECVFSSDQSRNSQEIKLFVFNKDSPRILVDVFCEISRLFRTSDSLFYFLNPLTIDKIKEYICFLLDNGIEKNVFFLFDAHRQSLYFGEKASFLVFLEILTLVKDRFGNTKIEEARSEYWNIIRNIAALISYSGVDNINLLSENIKNANAGNNIDLIYFFVSRAISDIGYLAERKYLSKFLLYILLFCKNFNYIESLKRYIDPFEKNESFNVLVDFILSDNLKGFNFLLENQIIRIDVFYKLTEIFNFVLKPLLHLDIPLSWVFRLINECQAIKNQEILFDFFDLLEVGYPIEMVDFVVSFILSPDFKGDINATNIMGENLLVKLFALQWDAWLKKEDKKMLKLQFYFNQILERGVFLPKYTTGEDNGSYHPLKNLSFLIFGHTKEEYLHYFYSLSQEDRKKYNFKNILISIKAYSVVGNYPLVTESKTNLLGLAILANDPHLVEYFMENGCILNEAKEMIHPLEIAFNLERDYMVRHYMSCLITSRLDFAKVKLEFRKCMIQFCQWLDAHSDQREKYLSQAVEFFTLVSTEKRNALLAACKDHEFIFSIKTACLVKYVDNPSLFKRRLQPDSDSENSKHENYQPAKIRK